MPVENLNVAETWDKIYQAFELANFNSFDYDTIKESLIQYLKVYYPENFNDFIETSELIQMIESFAIVAEQLAYRVDMSTHEVGISTAERKKSILKLVKFISYKPTRNYPARGLVKLTSISTTERIIDSQGNNLQNRSIVWNDPNNSLWKEQFFLVVNKVLSSKFGQPSKVFQVGDVEFELYQLINRDTSFKNSVHSYDVKTNSQTIPMEIVAADVDENGPFERYVDGTSTMQILYSRDGLGDGSDLTGFLMYTKQGRLTRSSFTFETPIPNRTVDIEIEDINEVDIWVNKLDSNGDVEEKWTQVESVDAQNIFFNTIEDTTKYEVESLEDDKIKIIFGDGNFSDVPVGDFEIWTRQSSVNSIINRNRVVNESLSFAYDSEDDVVETCGVTFSLINTLQNAAPSEDIEHIRRNAPLTYYSQNRMVNGQDYNTLPLKDSSILKLRSVNRTFAGQPKHIEWNDASGSYQNVKVFGDDLRLYYNFKTESVTTTISARNLIDDIVEPAIADPGIQNIISFINSTVEESKDVRTVPRTKFIEDASLAIQEKTELQGAIDRHFYGEPISYVSIAGVNHADVSNDTDFKIYADTIPLSIGETPINPGLGGIGETSGLQALADQPVFGLRFEFERNIHGNGSLTAIDVGTSDVDQVITIECINESDSNPTFAVTSNVLGDLGLLDAAEVFDSNGITFEITIGSSAFRIGDAFILTIVDNAYTQRSTNLQGRWFIIDGSYLDTDSDFDQTTAGSVDANSDSSWLIWIQRNEDEFGNTVDWTITTRDLEIICESPTTKFWFNNSDIIIDSDTKNRVRDQIEILKSNLNREGTLAIGTNQVYDIVGDIKHNSGVVNTNALKAFPEDIIDRDLVDANREASLQFSEFINITGENIDYVYFQVNDNGTLSPITATQTIIDGFTDDNLISDDELYQRRIGRNDLDFLWQHFSPNTNVVDPSTSNIHDIYVLTRGYYDSFKAYLDGTSSFEPVAPTPLELRNTYRDILNLKMLSDTVVMHSGKLKLLFGDIADPQLRGTFRIIKSPTASLTDDQIKSETLKAINTYFDISNWDFGDTLYITDLSSFIHKRLATEISSVVLVPSFVNNTFGSLFVIESGEDEVLQSAATVNDIEIVDAYTPSNLRQS